MSYHFSNKALIARLAGGTSPCLPDAYQQVFANLRNEVCRYSFNIDAADAMDSVATMDRSLTETASLVDWCAEILSAICERDVSTIELVLDRPLADGQSPVVMLLEVFDPWFEFVRPVERSPFVSLERYPSSSVSVEPWATIGNVCAALGLAVLDRIPSPHACGCSRVAIDSLNTAWELALLAQSRNRTQLAMHFQRHYTQTAQRNFEGSVMSNPQAGPQAFKPLEVRPALRLVHQTHAPEPKS